MSGITQLNQVAKARTSERTIVVGYCLAVAVAFLAFRLGEMARSGGFPSRYDFGGWLPGLMFVAAPITGIATVVPFTVVRTTCGARGVSAAWSAAVWGAVTGLLSVPFMVETGRIFDFEGPARPFLVDMSVVLPQLPLYVGAGIAGGLTYWLVEFSAFPVAAVRVLNDRTPLRWTGNWLSRRVALALCGAFLLAATGPVGEWWRKPRIYQASGTGMPKVAFEGDWRTGNGRSNSEIGFLRWSDDGHNLLALSWNLMTVRDQAYRILREAKLPYVNAPAAVGRQQFTVLPSQSPSSSPFAVRDVGTGGVLYEGADPAPGTRGVASAGVRLALSRDGFLLAVGYGQPRLGQPILLLSTRDWRKVSMLTPPLDAAMGVGQMAFSNDGSRLAIASGQEVLVCNIGTGAVVRRLQTWSGALAFSPGDDLLAIDDPQPTTERHVLRLFRLADGKEVASREAEAGIFGLTLAWDPGGRFIAYATGQSYRVHLWSPFTGMGQEAVISLRGFTGGLTVSPDGSYLAVGNSASDGDYLSIFRLGE